MPTQQDHAPLSPLADAVMVASLMAMASFVAHLWIKWLVVALLTLALYHACWLAWFYGRRRWWPEATLFLAAGAIVVAAMGKVIIIPAER